MDNKAILKAHGFHCSIMIVLLAVMTLFVPHGFNEAYELRELESSLLGVHAQMRPTKYKRSLSKIIGETIKILAPHLRAPKKLIFATGVLFNHPFEQIPPWKRQLMDTLLPYFHGGRFKAVTVAQP